MSVDFYIPSIRHELVNSLIKLDKQLGRKRSVSYWKKIKLRNLKAIYIKKRRDFMKAREEKRNVAEQLIHSEDFNQKRPQLITRNQEIINRTADAIYYKAKWMLEL